MEESEETLRARVALQKQINDNPAPKATLAMVYGADNVWDTEELKAAFTVRGFLAPFCAVVRKSDGVHGVVTFQHEPRYYFDFHAE